MLFTNLNTTFLISYIHNYILSPASSFPHFYDKEIQSVVRPKMCQCPMSGFLHFYYITDDDISKDYEKCQCPMLGFLHFYPGFLEPLYLPGCEPRFCKPILSFCKNWSKMAIFLFFNKIRCTQNILSIAFISVLSNIR